LNLLTNNTLNKKPSPFCYTASILPRHPSSEDYNAAAGDYKAIILSNLLFIIERFERNIGCPWIDTKYNLITGCDAAEDDPFCGKNAVYSWIQGRTLESLSILAGWLKNRFQDPDAFDLACRTDKVIKSVLKSVLTAREKNNGHLYFCLSPSGQACIVEPEGSVRHVKLDKESPYNFSDLFCSKGIYAAACHLEDGQLIKTGRDYISEVERALWDGTFRTDQPQTDPLNPVGNKNGRNGYSPFMIQIGAICLLMEKEPDSETAERGIRLINYIMENYVNSRKQFKELEKYDFCEYIDNSGSPYTQNGHILCDVGHVLEFVGLTLKFASLCRRFTGISRRQLSRIRETELMMPDIFIHNFNLGFNDKTGGIYKLFDLRSRRVYNPTMPWWSLPETIRAALLCFKLPLKAEQKNKLNLIFTKSHNAFIKNYIDGNNYLLAYQTLDEDGLPVNVIPAVPDIDPNYHTGLSLLESIFYLDSLN
jgi:mannose/cellobiose epimerase-like protein (N-acyl-D-glucosamine 2-epimerase family)